MGGGFVNSCSDIATGVSDILCLLIILLIVSPDSTVAYDQQSDGVPGSPPRCVEEIINTDGPLDLMDFSRLHRAVQGDEREWLPPAKEGAISHSVAESTDQGQRLCNYQLSIRTSCSSLPIGVGQRRRVEVLFGDGRQDLKGISSYRTSNMFAPCSVQTFAVPANCFPRICQIQLTYGAQEIGEWIPNYVKVFDGRQKIDNFCVGVPVGGGGFERDDCRRATGGTVAALPAAVTALAGDDDAYDSCGGAAAGIEISDGEPERSQRVRLK